MRSFLLAIACLTTAACVSQDDMATVETAVAEFHARQSAGEDAAIYEQAAPEMRQVARLDDLTRLNATVRNAPGCGPPVRNPNAWNNNVSTSGHFITVVYDRTCTNGPISETFVFKISGGEAAIVGYNVAGMGLFAPAEAPPAPEAQAEPAPELEPTATPAPEPAAQ